LTAVTGHVAAEADELLEEELEELELELEPFVGWAADPNTSAYVVAAATLPVAAAVSVTSRVVTADEMYCVPEPEPVEGNTPATTTTAPTPTPRRTTTSRIRSTLMQGLYRNGAADVGCHDHGQHRGC
jgi:hypothetical protein